jgi:hypothetical protein
VTGENPGAMRPGGVGWRTPSLPTAGGTRMTISLWVRGKDLKAKDPPAVGFFEFTDYTRQRVERAFFLGQDDAGAVQGGAPQIGTFEWREVQGAAVAPAWAKRTAVFLGLRPATGNVSFDDIRIEAE